MKPIPNFPEYYATEDGRIYSSKRGGRWLKSAVGRNGYPMVALQCGGSKQVTRTVHSLVLETFVGDRPEGCDEIRHLDGNTLNPQLTNLKYGTRKQNHADSELHGSAKRPPRKYGVDHHAARLTVEQVLSIRRRVAEGEKQTKVADEFGVTPQMVNRIVKRTAWKHI